MSGHLSRLLQVDGDLTTRNKCSIFYIQGASVHAVATIGSGAFTNSILLNHCFHCRPDPAAAAASELFRLNKMPTSQAIETRIRRYFRRVLSHQLHSKSFNVFACSKLPAGLALPEVLKRCASEGYNPNNPWN
jgi:hypothetical protein